MAAAFVRVLCALCLLGTTFALAGPVSLQPNASKSENTALLSVRAQVRVDYRRGTPESPAWTMTKQERIQQAKGLFSPAEMEPVVAKYDVMPDRLVVFGDIHGSKKALKLVLDAAQLIDKFGNWAGGDAWLVQTGDLLDGRREDKELVKEVKGAFERDIIHWLHTLRAQAADAGGKVILLLGNHELMNMISIAVPYTTMDNIKDFRKHSFPDRHKKFTTKVVENKFEISRARNDAMQPGSWMAKLLSSHPVFVKIGQFAFSHAGLIPHWITRMTELLNPKLQGEEVDVLNPPPPPPLPFNEVAQICQTVLWSGYDIATREGKIVDLVNDGKSGPLWTRAFGLERQCKGVDITRQSQELDVLVVGHTVQSGGITSLCDGHLLCVDVGMSEAFEGSAAPSTLAVNNDAIGSRANFDKPEKCKMNVPAALEIVSQADGSFKYSVVCADGLASGYTYDELFPQVQVKSKWYKFWE